MGKSWLLTQPRRRCYLPNKWECSTILRYGTEFLCHMKLLKLKTLFSEEEQQFLAACSLETRKTNQYWPLLVRQSYCDKYDWCNSSVLSRLLDICWLQWFRIHHCRPLNNYQVKKNAFHSEVVHVYSDNFPFNWISMCRTLQRIIKNHIFPFFSNRKQEKPAVLWTLAWNYISS